MRLTIKNAEAAHINNASQPNRLNVDVDGIKVEDVLYQINITDAIKY